MGMRVYIFGYTAKIQSIADTAKLIGRIWEKTINFALIMEKKDLKIVFFGTPEFAVTSLKALVDGGYNVAAVVTMPDKPAGRGKHLSQSDVKRYAIEAGIPVLQPEKLKDETFVEQLRAIGADLFIVIAFRMLPEVVWTMPRLGTFNLHGSLLPRYRGAAPINWAVINGDTETGVTTFFLKHEIDTGDVIDRCPMPIADDEDAGSVHDRMMHLGARLTVATVDRILAGNLTATPQSQLAAGETPTPAPKIFKDTCKIEWTRPADEIRNLIRGLSPYPAAWSRLMADGAEAGTFKLFASRLTDTPAVEPGKVRITADGRLTVDCGDVCLEILSLQAPGKRRMDTPEFLRGCRLNDMKLY